MTMAKNKGINAATATAESEAKQRAADRERAEQGRIADIEDARRDNERRMMIRNSLASAPGGKLLHPRDLVLIAEELRRMVIENGHRFPKMWRSIADKLGAASPTSSARSRRLGARKSCTRRRLTSSRRTSRSRRTPR